MTKTSKFVQFLIRIAFAASIGLLAGPLRAAPFAKGADVSWLPQMEAAGFTFRNPQGHKADCLAVLKSFDIDTVRLRVWVAPSDDPKNGHNSPQEMVEMADRANRMGFRIMIDFHYSDTWADPGHQRKPKAWENLDFPDLKQAMHDHTMTVLEMLKARGVTPEWVQIGNEIRDGMLWPHGQATKDPEQLAELINAGYRATKSVDPAIKVVVHLDRGHDIALYRWFFDKLRKHGAKYDVIGLSYYPYWLKEKHDYQQTIDALGKNLIDLAARYHSEVMIVETGGESVNPRETREMLEAVIGKVRAVPNKKGLGVIYWEPQAAASWSGYSLSAWADDGRPTAALEGFRDKSKND